MPVTELTDQEVESQASTQAGSQTDDANSSAAADDAQLGGAGAETPPSPSWRDQAKEHGLDLSTYKDDGDALKFLAERNKRAEEAETARREAEQFRELASYGREYLNVAPEFRQWYTERQQQAAAQQQKAQEDPFAPPEYNPAWLTQVKRDDLGGYIPDTAAGGTPEVVSKLLRHYEFRNNFMANPRQHLEGWVDTRAKQVAQEILQQQLPQIQRQFAASQFITNNREWLYAKDEQGAFSGELSEQGKAFQGFLTKAATPREQGGMGLDPEGQEAFALHSLSLWRQAQARGGNAAAAAKIDPKDEFLKKAAGHGAQSGGSANTPLRDAGANGQNVTQTLEEMLRANFKSSGIDDSVFNNV